MTSIRIPPIPPLDTDIKSCLGALFSEYLLGAKHVTRISIWSYSPSTSYCIQQILSCFKKTPALKRILHVELVTGFHRLSPGGDILDAIILRPLYAALSCFPNLESVAFLNLHQDDSSKYGGVLQDISCILTVPKLKSIQMVAIKPLSKASYDAFFKLVNEHPCLKKVVVSNALMSYSATDPNSPLDNDTTLLFCGLLRFKKTLKALEFKLDPVVQSNFTPYTYLLDWDALRFKHPADFAESRQYGFKNSSLTTLAYEISMHPSLEEVVLPGFAPMWTRNEHLVQFLKSSSTLIDVGFADCRPMKQVELTSSSARASSATVDSKKTPMHTETDLVVKYYHELPTDIRRRLWLSQYLATKNNSN